jgi:hypothetical protein
MIHNIAFRFRHWSSRATPGALASMEYCRQWRLHKSCLRFQARSIRCERKLLAVSCLSDRTSVCWHVTTLFPLSGFSWKWIFKYSSQICRENSSLIKIWQEWRALYMKNYIRFFIISRSFLLVIKNVSDKRHRKNQNTHLMYNCFLNREIMWKNTEEPDRPQMTIWRMLTACGIPKATNTHVNICNTYRFSTQSMDARTSLSVM